MFKNSIYKKAFLMLLWIIASMMLMRITNGFWGIVSAVVGICFAFSGKTGWSLCHYILLVITIIINPVLLPKVGGAWPIAMRVGPLLIGLALILKSVCIKTSHRLPFGGIVPFLMVACMSSFIGWAPQISYMKLINFTVFLMGIWFGTQDIGRRNDDVVLLRSMMLAICGFFILGSFVLYWFPSVSYLSSLRAYVNDGGMEAVAYAVDRMMDPNASAYDALFCGVTYQSQTLAPVLALCFSWVTCDMLFVEKRIRWAHLLLMGISIPLMYLTRSRVAFVALVSVLGIIYMYSIRKINVPYQVKQGVRKGAFLLGILMMLLAIVAEVRNNTVSQWVRKSNDVKGDSRSLVEAAASSRMGLIEQCMYEFRRSPIFGSGFQVDEDHQGLASRTDGFVLSAPIEKGLLPLMVLGETGIIGAVCFLFFLCSFYVTAEKRHLFVTISLFGVFFTANLGEATFFSPGGMGGTLWVLSFIGGFVIDTVLINEQRMRSMGRHHNDIWFS